MLPLTAAESHPAKDQKALKKKIASISHSLKLAAKKRTRVQKIILDLDHNISQISEKIIKNRLLISENQTHIQQFDLKKNTLLNNISISNQELGEVVKVLYMIQPQSRVKQLINLDQVYSVDQYNTYSGYLIRSYIDHSKALAHQLASLELVNQSLIKSHKTLQTRLKDQLKKQGQLEITYQEKQKRLKSLVQEIADKKQRLKSFQADSLRLDKLLKAIDKLKATKSDGMSFAELKGGYAWPVKGRVVRKFGRLRSGSKLKWRGVLIETQAGAKVSAVAKGRVVFADWLTGYGFVLIVEHDRGYMSLYGHNQHLIKNVGDKVRKNEQIAMAGNSGRSGKPALYFEIRRNGKPVNPAKWMIANKARP